MKDDFPVNEMPLCAEAWQEAAGSSRLEVLEADLRGLMLRLAQAHEAAEQGERSHAEQKRRLLLSLLEIMDAFERVFHGIQAKKSQCTPQMNIWLGNFRTIYRLLGKTLGEQGVRPIENLGQGFDPYWHQVVETSFDPSQPEGRILQEVQRGYVLHEQILRKSGVVVVSHGEPQTSGE